MEGATTSNLPGPSSLMASSASFSQAISTSPMPALHEGGGRAAGAGVEHRHVLVEPRDEVLGASGLVAARLAERPGPRREVVPARAARGLGVGRDHRDAGLGQVAPVLDALRVALAHQEHDGRGVGRAVVGQPLLPVGRKQPGLLGDLVDVVGQRQRHHVGLQAVDDRAGLLARAAVRLPDGDVLARLRLPVLGELLVEVLVELARRIVGDVEQGHRLPAALGDGRTGAGRESEEASEPIRRMLHGVHGPLIGSERDLERVKKKFSASRSPPSRRRRRTWCARSRP